MKTYLIKTILFFVLFVSVCQAHAQAMTQIAAKTQKAIFTIYTYDEYGKVKGLGTGFFIDAKGTAVTNHHVLMGSSKAIIILKDGEMYEIDKILKADKDKDLVVFSIKNPKKELFSSLILFKKNPLSASSIFVISNSKGLALTFAAGSISAVSNGGAKGTIVQFYAPIAAESSGSPVMDAIGRVVGVVTSPSATGKNLNFAVAASEIAHLPAPTQSILLPKDDRLVTLNTAPKGENDLIYHAIHFGKDTTTVYCSFTNMQIMYRNGMLIWAQLGKKDKGFYLQDNQTNEKFYILASSVGESRDTGTKVKLGENKTFKIFFPAMPTVKNIGIIEGSGNSNWSLPGIDLDYFRKEDNNLFQDIYKDYGLLSLEYNDYESAIKYFGKNIQKNQQNSKSYHLMAIIAALIDNYDYALKYINLAIQINPDDDVYYTNRFEIHSALGKEEEATDDLSLAISTNPSQPDYYYYRAFAYIRQGKWEEAKKDVDACILKENNQAAFYYTRALCYQGLKQVEKACKDAQTALGLDPEYEGVQQFIKENCTKSTAPKNK